jgi:probable F420-dependent oxidoreductase
VHLGVALGNLGLTLSGSTDPLAHAALVYRLADEAERLGFHSVWAGDHLALPRSPTTRYPYGEAQAPMLDPDHPLLDPFAVLAALAGRTDRVKLGFGVLVLPFRHPLPTAKLIATIDALSAGRVILGAGTGWMPEEFAAAGCDFARRGADTDACLHYLRRAFTNGEVDGMTLLPMTVQRPAPPIWVGGQSPAAMRRAVELGDGWDAPYIDPEALRHGVDDLHALCRAADRDPASLTLSVRGLFAPDVDESLLHTYAEVGVTHVGVILPTADPDLAVTTLEQLARRCRRHLASP